MCKRYIYARVSTSGQGFEQQMQEIKNYGVNPDEVDGIVSEHESGGKSYVDREFQKLLNKCKPGDIIYAASTDRLGRSFVDMIRLMEDAKKHGIIIVACKQKLRLDSDDLATKVILSVTAIVDEDERMRIQHRIKNKKQWQREQIEKQGYYIVERGPNKGQKSTYMGREKGSQNPNMVKAASEARIAAQLEWKNSSLAYRWVIDRFNEGWKYDRIAEEFNKLHELQPDVFCTRTGKKISRGTISHWIAMTCPV